MNIDEPLDELSRMPKASAPPYLLTRIQARLRNATGQAPASWRWALALGAAAVLMLNAFAFSHLSSEERQTSASYRVSPHHDPYE